MNKQFFRDYGYTQEEVLRILSDAMNICDKTENGETAEQLGDVLSILKIEWNLDD